MPSLYPHGLRRLLNVPDASDGVASSSRRGPVAAARVQILGRRGLYGATQQATGPSRSASTSCSAVDALLNDSERRSASFDCRVAPLRTTASTKAGSARHAATTPSLYISSPCHRGEAPLLQLLGERHGS